MGSFTFCIYTWVGSCMIRVVLLTTPRMCVPFVDRLWRSPSIPNLDDPRCIDTKPQARLRFRRRLYPCQLRFRAIPHLPQPRLSPCRLLQMIQAQP